MRIRYSSTSRFLEPAKHAIKQQSESLNAGKSVHLNFGGDYEYLEEQFMAVIADEDTKQTG